MAAANDQPQAQSGTDPYSPDHTPVRQLDPQELLRRVTERVYALWQAEERVARERNRLSAGQARFR